MMRGWKLTIVISAGLLVMFALQLAYYGIDEDGLRVVVRATARTSVLLFAMAFGASSSRTFWRSDITKWMLANRRYIGVSYAVSHFIHATALVALYPTSVAFREELSVVTLAGGGLAYAFTLAMAVTSNDAAVAALGRSRWRLLHTIGGWYIWAIFAQSYIGRAVTLPEYIPAAAFIFGVAGIRLASRTRRTKGVSSPRGLRDN
jgi:sulfoxide reductase heme-binding subunit YedZ